MLALIKLCHNRNGLDAIEQCSNDALDAGLFPAAKNPHGGAPATVHARAGRQLPKRVNA